MKQLDLKPFKKVMYCDDAYGEPFSKICEIFCVSYSYGNTCCYAGENPTPRICFMLVYANNIKEDIDRAFIRN